jgi:hypothetical protein
MHVCGQWVCGVGSVLWSVLWSDYGEYYGECWMVTFVCEGT